MTKSIKTILIAHRPYWMPIDGCYLPVQVGCVGKETIHDSQRNDEGDNISSKNLNCRKFKELNLSWKNLDADYLGLAHNRRHFAVKSSDDKNNRAASGEQLAESCSTTGVTLPKARNYSIKTNYTQYEHAHHDDFFVHSIIADCEPKKTRNYYEIMNRTYGHRFNMFAMHRNLSNACCERLFDELFKLDYKLDISDYGKNDACVFGFVSEQLFDCWIGNNRLAYLETPVVNLENQHWLKKGIAFISRKVRV